MSVVRRSLDTKTRFRGLASANRAAASSLHLRLHLRERFSIIVELYVTARTTRYAEIHLQSAFSSSVATSNNNVKAQDGDVESHASFAHVRDVHGAFRFGVKGVHT